MKSWRERYLRRRLENVNQELREGLLDYEKKVIRITVRPGEYLGIQKYSELGKKFIGELAKNTWLPVFYLLVTEGVPRNLHGSPRDRTRASPLATSWDSVVHWGYIDGQLGLPYRATKLSSLMVFEPSSRREPHLTNHKLRLQNTCNVNLNF